MWLNSACRRSTSPTQLIEQPARALPPRPRQLPADGLEEGRVAREQPRVEQRQQKLRIVVVQVRDLRQLHHLVADGETQVPERVEHRFDDPLFGRADGAVEDEEQIDVGVQAQRPAAIAAERRDRKGRDRRSLRRVDDVANQIVNAPRIPGHGQVPALAGPDLCAVLTARCRELIRQPWLAFERRVFPGGHRACSIRSGRDRHDSTSWRRPEPRQQPAGSDGEAGFSPPLLGRLKPAPPGPPLSICNPDAEHPDRFEAVAAVHSLRRVAEPQQVDAAMDVQRRSCRA